jgi:hypothetical protein
MADYFIAAALGLGVAVLYLLRRDVRTYLTHGVTHTRKSRSTPFWPKP